MTAAQAAIGWVASQGDDITPLIGARTPLHLAVALASPLRLSPDMLLAFEDAVPRDAVHERREIAAGR